MKIKYIYNLCCVFIIIGFVAGLLSVIPAIISNQYIHYKMFRIAGLLLQHTLNELMVILLSCFISFVIIFSLLQLLFNFVLLKNYLQTGKGRKAIKIVLSAFCFAFFCYSSWAVKHYYLPDRNKFHPISLITIGGLFILMLLLRWALLKITKHHVTAILKAHVTTIMGISTVSCIIFLNIALFLDGRISSPQGPNIIIMVIDALRADHLGCYGYNKNTSPFIDTLAADGVIFTNAYSNASWTKPSVASLFTSLYPTVHRVLVEDDILQNSVITIAEILKDKGYVTSQFNSGNPNVSRFNFTQGFDITFTENLDNSNLGRQTIDNFLSTHLFKFPQKKFFAYIHFMNTHAPYGLGFDAMKEIWASKDNTYKLQYLRPHYESQIRVVDSYIREVIDKLKKNNLLENTIIIITADHGEEFFDHHDWRHGHTLYDELLHVPLIITGGPIKHREIHAKVRLIDILPTILDFTGAGMNSSFGFQGSSLVNMINGVNETTERQVFATATNIGRIGDPKYCTKYCIIAGNKKLILSTFNKSPEQAELYDLLHDPHEKNNIKDTATDSVSQLKTDLVKFKNISSPFKDKKIVIDSELKEQLRALGYVQ